MTATDGRRDICNWLPPKDGVDQTLGISRFARYTEVIPHAENRDKRVNQ